MLLFVGLGNPTPDSQNNRHNIGFKIIDAINKKFSLSKQKPKFKGLLTTGNISNTKVYAIKPLTFMNNSGICIRELIEYFKIEAENVIVFHDDLDINFGKIKAKFGGSSAGHNGIASIDKFIGKDYSRVRIGIGKPNSKIATSDYVLKQIRNFANARCNFFRPFKIQLGPNFIKRINKCLNIFSRMFRRYCYSKSFISFWNSRIKNWLDINTMLFNKNISGFFTEVGIVKMNRDNMTVVF